MSKIQPGHYRHFKGKDYEVLGMARHSETEEALVVYRQLYGDFALWVRPAAMFEETTLLDGEEIPRFTFVSANRPLRLLSGDAQERARAFINTQGRPLERALYSYHFDDGSAEAVLAELGHYRNDDGGFGHGIEPDLQTPDSSVLGTTVALQISALAACRVNNIHWCGARWAISQRPTTPNTATGPSSRPRSTMRPMRPGGTRKVASGTSRISWPIHGPR